MLGREDRVAQQHCPGHRAHTADARRDPAGHLGCRLLHVGEQPLAITRDTGANDRRFGPSFYERRLNKERRARDLVRQLQALTTRTQDS